MTRSVPHVAAGWPVERPAMVGCRSREPADPVGARLKAAWVALAEMPALPISEIIRGAAISDPRDPGRGGMAWLETLAERTKQDRRGQCRTGPTMLSRSAHPLNSDDEGAVRAPSCLRHGCAPCGLDGLGVTGGRPRLDRPSATAGPGFFPPAAAPPLQREAKKPGSAALHCVAAPRTTPLRERNRDPGGCGLDRPRS